MNRAATLALGLLALTGTAAAKDLVGVFQDAVQNDPTIRQANANRLATREARPQAWAQVLPQLNATAAITRDHTSGFQDQVAEISDPNCVPSATVICPTVPVVVSLPTTIDTTTRNWAVNLRSNLFSWTNWMNIKAAAKEVAQAEATYQAAEQDLILRVATAYFVVLAADDTLLREPGGAGSDPAPARPGRQALRGRTHRDHRRAGGEGRRATPRRPPSSPPSVPSPPTSYRLEEITGQKYDRSAKPGPDMPLKAPNPRRGRAGSTISLEQNLVAGLEPPGGGHRARQRARRLRRTPADARPGRRPHLHQERRRPGPRGRRRSATWTASSTTAISACSSRCRSSAAALRSRRCARASTAGLPPRRRWSQSSRATERARPATRYLGVISGIARVQALLQALRVEPDRAQGDRGRLRSRNAHRGRRAERAPHTRAGADRLRRQPLRLHRERAAAARWRPAPSTAPSCPRSTSG